MVEAAAAKGEGGSQRFLTFRVDERHYALAADQVSEVIRTPEAARVPHSPKSLLGLANLRGAILPLASARGLLGRPEIAVSAAARAIVLRRDAPVALSVDAIGKLVSVEAGRLQDGHAALMDDDAAAVSGAFQLDGEDQVAKVLDVNRLLDAAFTQRARPERSAQPAVASVTALSPKSAEAVETFITFEVAGQEYGLALGAVLEVICVPNSIASAPHSEALVLGVVAYRDTLLPLLALRGLLGFPPRSAGMDGHVLVTRIGGVLVGLVADRMRAVLAADPALIEPTPPLLAARAGGETRVKSIYRGDDGRRLVSILTPEQLFREDVMRRIGEERPASVQPSSASRSADQRQFLVFRLGDETFGLPIEAVDEVARAPERITRIPKTPKFLEGVVNLRGEVLPVIDQRRRFDLAPLDKAEGRRMIVMHTDNRRAGLIVDSVSEVLRCSADEIDEAPELAGETTRLVYGVVNLQASGRLVLLLDPAELLTRTERRLLDAFKPETVQARL